jgi:chaperonin GroEL
MNKELTFRKIAMEKMLIGLNKAADAVGGTLGPKGLNCFIDDNLTPKITNDGATIADKIVFEDKLENAGAYIIRNTSSQTNDDAGDGTTTTAVLTQAIINECVKRPENPMVIKDSLKEAGNKILKTLSKLSRR